MKVAEGVLKRISLEVPQGVYLGDDSGIPAVYLKTLPGTYEGKVPLEIRLRVSFEITVETFSRVPEGVPSRSPFGNFLESSFRNSFKSC